MTPGVAGVISPLPIRGTFFFRGEYGSESVDGLHLRALAAPVVEKQSRGSFLSFIQ